MINALLVEMLLSHRVFFMSGWHKKFKIGIECGVMKKNVFNNKDFSVLWISQFLSFLGDQFYLIVVPLQLLIINHNPSILALFFSMSLLPRILLMFLGGTITDLLKPKKAIILADIIRGLLLLSLAVVSFVNNVPLSLFLIIGFSLGVMGALFDPAISSIIPFIVPQEQLPKANGMFQISRQFAMVAGPILAGLVLTLFNSTIVYSFDAFTYFISVVGAFLISKDVFMKSSNSIKGKVKQNNKRSNFVTETFSKINNKSNFMLLLVVAGLINISLIAIIQVGFPVIANEYNHNQGVFLGLIFSCFGFGTILANFLAGVINKSTFKQVFIVLSALIGGTSLFVLTFGQIFILKLFFITLFGFSISIMNVYLINETQKLIPLEIMGRGMSLLMTVTTLTQLVSLLLGMIENSLKPLILLSSILMGITAIVIIVIYLKELNINKKTQKRGERYYG
jgi:MFS transporter, DHA3 family, macrolide efflux protein